VGKRNKASTYIINVMKERKPAVARLKCPEGGIGGRKILSLTGKKRERVKRRGRGPGCLNKYGRGEGSGATMS